MKKNRLIIALLLSIILYGCSTDRENANEEKQDSVEVETESQDTPEVHILTKAEVYAMREQVLEGMAEEEIERLTENIKVANLRMESAYLNDNIFEKLEDAENFIELLEEMKGTVKNEKLQTDLQQMIDETALAAETHEMEYAYHVYQLLHDMDYYLLRYGLEDVGKYVQDVSTLAKYYGVLSVYD